ncbi:peptidoglycan editing factor PgeF [Candidatus Roizmanbacteria bacterium]|nr:peptidoglycan editing factor PgeF [Candidatus Roizmanbacteria bacterium]
MKNYNAKLKIFTSSKLVFLPDLIHGFTTRHTDIQQLLVGTIIFPHQVHGNTVQAITSQSLVNYSQAADALVTNKINIAIGVKTADCVPILLYEPVSRIIAAVHAGWKGTVQRIVEWTIDTMKSLGGQPSNIIVSFGPSIGMCCYNVPNERAEQFIDEFGTDHQLLSEIEGKLHLNLAYANYKQLLVAGVSAEHIDYSLVCTSCQNDLFYSYRKEKEKLSEEVISFIQLLRN